MPTAIKATINIITRANATSAIRPVTDSEFLGKYRLSHSLLLPAECYEFSDFDLIHIGHLLSWLKHIRNHCALTRTDG
jgi:hypothetical protein